MRRFHTAAIALVLMTLFALPAQAADPAALEGKITNSSKAGEPVPGLEVLLRPSDGGSERKTLSNNEGTFRFESLIASNPISYTVSLSYAGVDYSSPAITFGANENAKRIDVPVYDTTDDSSVIEAGIAHIILDIDPSQRFVRVTEFHSLSNNSDRVYVGKKSSESGQRELVRFPAPDGAIHLQSLDDVGEFSLTPLPNGGGFVDATPFQPGKRDLAFAYALLYDGASLVLKRPAAYNTGRINILVSDVGATVSAPGFTNQQPAEFGGNRYLVLSASGLAQGQDVQLQLSGLPLSGVAPQGATDNLRLVTIVLVLLAMALVLVFFFLRNRRIPIQTATANTPAGSDKVQLVRSLVELDDRFERGQIPEAEHGRLRAEIKRKLSDLW